MSTLLENWNHPDSDRYRGAPLGLLPLGTAPAKGISLTRIRLDAGGYSTDGTYTYWGVGKPIYRASAHGYMRHVRAGCREEAMQLLGLDSNQLLRGL